jgi:ATP-binding cassette subfamily B protein
MTYTSLSLEPFLLTLTPFHLLSTQRFQQVAQQLQPLRYRVGQVIIGQDQLPTQIVILYEGQGRLLGYDPRDSQNIPITLSLLQPGAILGWSGLVRGVPCETAIASTESIGLTLAAPIFLQLLNQEPQFAAYFRDRCSLSELFALLGAELNRGADATTSLKALIEGVETKAVVQTLDPGLHSLEGLDTNLTWWLSGGTSNKTVGERLSLEETLKVPRSSFARLVGLPTLATSPPQDAIAVSFVSPKELRPEIPYASDYLLSQTTHSSAQSSKFPIVRGRGPLDATLACLEMLARYWRLPWREETIRRLLTNHWQRTGGISLALCGAITEFMGLKTQLVETPTTVFPRLRTPAIITWQDSIAVLYRVSAKDLILGVPEQGLVRQKTAHFLEDWGESNPVLLLEPTQETPQQHFSLRWFLPSIVRYRKVLIEVLLASFFVQLFALANPLGIQVIIDKVLVQNSLSTLNVLGTFLIVVAIFQALLTSFRTYLFVDTTNRIDLTLGAEVIDHLLRLPLRYFDRRPVGELATRINELENIRQFLTGTALTVVLDAIFSVIYLVVMVFYSWLLTLVALATVPLFALLTLIFAPIIRQKLRTKAEYNSDTQALLVEVVSGIQTVKAQNIELKARWQWQERYARYISAGFQSVIASTTAGAFSNFFNQLSGLLLLWVGAFLVLQGELSLGELIAFRIIASYITSPLLRLIQLWQNFQETALSLERLSDILDHPQEVEAGDRSNIPLPKILGAVQYEEVSFSFKSQGALQLNHISFEIPAGRFVGIAGQSGSGKSTLMKLLMRLYETNSGRILIDGYDIAKVELNSLRSQIGMVLQDSVLFDGTVQENIALSRPDASPEEIIGAAKVADAHEFIMTLSQGYNTRVGERGASLSGGQRQRIAIARTVLQNPPLLILDEATSALDYNTERQVFLNLLMAFQGRTVFFITHRLKTLQGADHILMMNQGQIAEQGTHSELMTLQGLYACLYQQQEMQI